MFANIRPRGFPVLKSGSNVFITVIIKSVMYAGCRIICAARTKRYALSEVIVTQYFAIRLDVKGG